MMDDRENAPVTSKPLELANPERLEELEFEIRWHVEYLVSSRKLVAKLFTKEVFDLLASAKTQNQIATCITYLDKFTRQRPNWNEFKEALAKCPPDDVKTKIVSAYF